MSIAYSHIKERRKRKIVPIGPGGRLADYVPFYFAPRSPMLHSIHTGWVEGYEGGQGSVLHLVGSAEAVGDRPLPFVFSDGHAAMQISEFYDDLQDLGKVDWQVMEGRWWMDTDEDPDRKRRRQAEFLVHEFFPWDLVTEVATISRGIADEATRLLHNHPHKPLVTVRPGWYY